MNGSRVRTYEANGFEFVAIENDELRAVFLPEVGAKIVELRNLNTGHQYLLGPQNPERVYTRPTYGGDFSAYDTSGADDCFPTVARSRYRSLSHPGGSYDIEFPDHGELWSRPWIESAVGGGLRFSIRGVRARYELEKSVTLQGNMLSIQYVLRNHWKEPLSYVWSAHPLLSVHPGMRILLPAEVRDILLNWSSDASVGDFGDTLQWPNLHPGRRTVDFADVQDPSLGIAVKCFTGRLANGRAAVYDGVSDESLMIAFDPAENPYLGLWLCYGGWPVSSPLKHFTVALEPCSGRPDSLEESVRRGECSEVLPGKERSWKLAFSLWKGLPPGPGLR